MTPDQIFSIANFAALCCWLLLIVLPGRTWVNHVVAGVAVPAAFAALYSVIIALHFAGSEGGFSSLADVALLFSNPWLLLADGSTTSRSICSSEAGKPVTRASAASSHLLVVPCLILTFLFGPAGWLFYLGVRTQVHTPVQRSSSTIIGSPRSEAGDKRQTWMNVRIHYVLVLSVFVETSQRERYRLVVRIRQRSPTRFDSGFYGRASCGR